MVHSGIYRLRISMAVVAMLSWSGLVGTASGGFMESFEDVPIGKMPPGGWYKWQPRGGRGWSNSWAGRYPMPGWMGGTNSVPPDPDAGSRMAAVTYMDGAAKTNDLWLVTPELRGVVSTSCVSFWYRSCFSNFADNIRVYVTTNPHPTSTNDFKNIQAFSAYFPRNWPNDCGPGVKCDYPPWTNIVVNIGSLVPTGSTIRVAFQEYHPNNWYDVRYNELDVVRIDNVWGVPVLSVGDIRVVDPTTIEVDCDIEYDGSSSATSGICWSPGSPAIWSDHTVATGQGEHTVTISNFPTAGTYTFRAFVHNAEGNFYSDEERVVYAGDGEGEGLLFESFEDVPIGKMPPAGWQKWQPYGGRGWSNSWAGRYPMPGWMGGTNSVPPTEGAGSRMAAVTYMDGAAKTNNNWLVSPPLKDIPANYDLSFWYRSCFSNFADNIYVLVSTAHEATRTNDFTIAAAHAYFPRNWPNDCTPPAKCDYPPWTNIITDIGALVGEGAELRIAFREYHPNNWYDVRYNEMDVITAGRRPRSSLRFDGVDDRVVLPLTNHPTAYTIEAWVRPLATGAMNILTATAGDPLITYSHQLRLTAGGVFQHYVNDGALKVVTGTTTVQTGKWYHVCGTATNGGTIRLYVNGTEEGTPAAVGTMWPGQNEMQVAAATGGGFAAFDGMIDEVRFWTVVRTPEQIQDAMNVYLRGAETGLVADYRFDRTFGTDVFNSRQHAAFDTWFPPATNSRAWREEADYFNGVSNKVVLAATNTPGYTIEAWVRPVDRSARSIALFTASNPLTSYNRQLRINSAGRFEFYAYDGAVRLVTGTTVLQSNTWYHVAGTSTNGDIMRLYVNGIEENNGPSGNTLWGTGNQFQVGAASGGGFTWFKGWIRDVAITNRVKTGAEFLAQINPLLDAAKSPQWTELSAPLGDHVASQQWKNRGIWELRTDASASRGLRVEAASASGFTNYFVFGDNNLTGGTNSDLPAGPAKGRQRREWHLDFHGETQQVADLFFDPIAGGSTILLSVTNNYLLLRRDSTNGTFSVVRTSANALAGGEAIFNAVPLDEGYYTLGVGEPEPPAVLPATNITAHTFHANWNSVTNVTGYRLDVSANAAFSSYVAGYQNLALGDVVTASVTGLLPGATHYYRLRSERDGVPSTNSATESLTTLTEGAIGIDMPTLTFNCVYGANPAAQTFVLTNRGQTAYAFSNAIVYSAGASGWMAAITGAVAANSSLIRTARVTAAGLNAGSYWATNSIVSATATNSPQKQFVSLTIAKADQSITFPAIANHLTTDAVGLAATASSGLGVSFAVASGPATISGGTNLSFTGAGSVSIVASQAGNGNWNAATSLTNTFTVTKAMASVTLGSLAQVYDGTPRIATASTVPAGLTVGFTYDGNATAPSNAGTYAVTGTINDVMYQGSASGALVVSKAGQAITFPAIADQLATNQVGLAATASSGLGVSFAVGSGPASIAGGTNLTFSTSGTVSIVASQGGDSNWNPAPNTTNIFTVAKAAASVFLLDLAQTYDGTARTITATSMPAGLTVDFTYDGAAPAPTNAGSYVVTGTVNDVTYQGVETGSLVVARALDTITFGDTNQTYDGTARIVTATADSGSTVDLTYDGSTSAPVNVGVYSVTGIVDALNWEATNTTTLTIIKADQSITFPAIADQETTNAMELAATADSGLVISFAVAAGPATIAGGTNLSFTGAGSVSIVASQGGDTNWNAAPDVTNTFTVAKAVASVFLLDLAQTYDGTARTITATTMPAGLTVEITYDGSGTAPSNAGTYVVTGTVNDVMYQGSAADSLVVAKADQSIGFPAIADQLTTDTVGLAAVSESGLPVGFAVESGPASIAGGTNLSFTTEGSVSIVASQAGNADWNPAPNVTNAFNVTKDTATVYLLDLAQVYDGTARTIAATTTPAGLAVEFTYDGNAWAPTNAGTYAVTGTVNDLIYKGSAADSLVVARGIDTITFSDTNQVYDGTARAVTATAGSGSPVAVTYDGAAPAPVNVGSYAVTGIVDTANWTATNTTTLTIIKGDQIITNFLPADGAQFILGSSTTVSAQASSGLAVGFTNLAPEIADLAGTDVAFTNPGLARVQAFQDGDTNWNMAATVVHEWRVGGLITNVVPAEANVGGGIDVVIQGVWLGDGTDITNVTLAGVEALIVTQSQDEVTVLAEAAPAAATGDVSVASATGGFMVLSNAFEYLWLAAPIQLDPADITISSLLARWQNSSGATTHLLDVGLDTNFAAYVPGYEGLDVGLAQERSVTGLLEDTFHAIRLFAWNAAGFSLPSRTVWISTRAEKPYDFDGDGQADLVVFYPTNGTWSLASYRTDARWDMAFGWSKVVPVPADYDGDGVTDFAVYHPAAGNWYYRPSGGGPDVVEPLGSAAAIPLPGDYDGDGVADLAVFDRNALGGARWSFRCSTDGDYGVSWGWSKVVPAPADYDGDGRTDVAVYHPDTGNWYVLQSSDAQLRLQAWGWSKAIPVPGDYDGDGKADVAVFHRATATWYIQYSSGGSLTQAFGWSSVVPVPADYDGDGKTDIAVYHPASGIWYVRQSSDGTTHVKLNGGPGKVPALLYPLIHSWFGLP